MLSESHKQAILARFTRVPIFSTLKIEILALDEGYSEGRIPRQKNYDGIYESFHGGILMTLADSMAALAVMTLLSDPNEILTTTDMNIRFLSPCLSDAAAKCRVIKFGRTLCPIAVELFDANGKQVAVGQVNYMRLSSMPSR
jgi:uncharacterized protein (TIGR00369 family)